jgi:DnaJ-class molecular chaperone
MMVISESIIEELKREHGILNIAVPCPCSTGANSATGHPKKNCAYCHGHGHIQYGIDEVTFFT